MRQKASNPYISFALFPAHLPLFWHFSARPKLLVLGEALTQNFKKILRTNLRKQTSGGGRGGKSPLALVGGVEGLGLPSGSLPSGDPTRGSPASRGHWPIRAGRWPAGGHRGGAGWGGKVAFPPPRVWGRPLNPGGARPGAPAAARPSPPCARQPVRASPPRRWRPERRRGTSGSRRAPGACLAADPRPRHTDVNRSARPAPRGPRPPPPSRSARDRGGRPRGRVGAVGGVGARRARPGAGAQRPPSLPPSGSLSSPLLRRLSPHPPFPQPPLGPASELALAFPILGKQIQLATEVVPACPGACRGLRGGPGPAYLLIIILCDRYAATNAASHFTGRETEAQRSLAQDHAGRRQSQSWTVGLQPPGRSTSLGPEVSRSWQQHVPSSGAPLPCLSRVRRGSHPHPWSLI